MQIKNTLKKKLFPFLIAVGISCSPAVSQAQSSEGSIVASWGVALVLAGSVTAVAGSGQVIVESVETVGESMIVVLKSLPDLSVATLKLSGMGVGAASVLAGEALELVSHAAGTLLVRGGEILAMIPNEIGKSLLHQSLH